VANQNVNVITITFISWYKFHNTVILLIQQKGLYIIFFLIIFFIAFILNLID